MIFILNHPKYFLESKINSLLSNEDLLVSLLMHLWMCLVNQLLISKYGLVKNFTFHGFI